MPYKDRYLVSKKFGMLFEPFIFADTFGFTVYNGSISEEEIIEIFEKYKDELGIDFSFHTSSLCYETNDYCWYIYPYKGEIKDNILVISDEVKFSKYWQRSVYNPDINNPALKKILSTFRENKIFYASDLCGTDFKQAIDFEILR